MKNPVGLFAIVALTHTFFHACVDAQNVGNATSVAMADPERAVNAHNEKRRIPSASDMKLLTWNNTLASQAQDYAETCNFAHDANRGRVGENIYLTSGSPSQLYVSAVESWYNEVDYFTYEPLGCDQGKECGHYTQVVWANSQLLGCGAADCPIVTGVNGFTDSKIVVCRYSPAGNFQGTKPYESGAACSACDSGWICNDGLCQDPSTTTTTVQTTSTTEPSTTSTTTSTTSSTTTPATPPSSAATPPATSSTTTTSSAASNPSSSTTSSSTTSTTSGTTSTQATQNNSTSTSTNGSTTSTTQATSTSTESPTESGCSAEYSELLEQWLEAFNEWRSEFNSWRDGNCGTNNS